MDGLRSRLLEHYKSNRRKFQLVSRHGIVVIMRSVSLLLRQDFHVLVFEHPTTELRAFKASVGQTQLRSLAAQLQDIPYSQIPSQLLFGVDWPQSEILNAAEGLAFLLCLIYGNSRLIAAFCNSFGRDGAFQLRLKFTPAELSDSAIDEFQQKARARYLKATAGDKFQLDLQFERPPHECSVLRSPAARGFPVSGAVTEAVWSAAPRIPRAPKTRKTPRDVTTTEPNSSQLRAYTAIGLPPLEIRGLAMNQRSSRNIAVVLNADYSRCVYDCARFYLILRDSPQQKWVSRFIANIPKYEQEITEIQRFWRLEPRQLVVVFSDFVEVSASSGQIVCIRRLGDDERAALVGADLL